MAGQSSKKRSRGEWCVLTTSGARTLPLLRALQAAGYAAWAPIRKVTRPGRGKQRSMRTQVDVPMLPTFVFVASADVARLRQHRRQDAAFFPSFTVLRRPDFGDVEIADVSLSQMRAAEERFARSYLKNVKRHVEVGSSVRMNTGAFAGLTGIVESGSGKEARVNFGHGFVVTIASYLLGTDVVQTGPQPSLGIAA